MTNSALQFIDSHAHLDIYKPEELPGVLERMRQANTRAISVGTHAQDWPIIAALAQEHPEILGYTVGLHPSEVEDSWREDITLMEKILSEQPTLHSSLVEDPEQRACSQVEGLHENRKTNISGISGSLVEDPEQRACLALSNGSDRNPSQQPRLLAIGEIGLDYWRLEENPSPREFVENQKKAFAAQLSIIKSANLPVAIHARGEGAFRESLQMIDAAKLDWTRVVFHCFGEGPEEMRELNARGGRGSFTGIITFKNGGKAREAMLAQGPERLMLETDAPFLSPEPFRGKPNEPGRVLLIAAKAAELFGMPLQTFAPMVMRTTEAFFGVAAGA